MFIAMNRFKIVKGKEKQFEDVWKNRDTHLQGVNGFKEFHLVKGNSEKRAEIIHTLMEGQDMAESSASTNDTGETNNLDSEIMSEWEKRLEGLK